MSLDDWFVFSLLSALLILGATACSGASTSQAAQSPTLDQSPSPTGIKTETESPALTPEPPTLEPTTSPTEPPPSSTPAITNTPAPTATFPANNVTGQICFPGAEVPPMTAYFEQTSSGGEIIAMQVNSGQDSFAINLPPATYIAYIWLDDFSRGGLYSRAVPCGLGSDCQDHTMLPFEVSAREVSSGIDLCDWFAFEIPYPPDVDRSQITGIISGSLVHPPDNDAAVRVVAFNLRTTYWYWVIAAEEQTAYTIDELPPGDYHIVAYTENGQVSGYVDGNHELLPVTVEVGETTSGVDILDWSAPPESFPPDPTR